MNPVVGLDVVKEESQVQAFLDQSKPYGKSSRCTIIYQNRKSSFIPNLQTI
ncbi:hypothetical protein QUF86_19720 [Peribacillus sp. NJ11]|uniref:hypothetical protein n=1 Tax=Peribacillus sp. NJ11 TaxID=3055861 RepID=UPI0025A1A687|nr:hypothetical protein [Peribacillus sp. NJ11]MDM5222928.1 hypothetical protein [Peribacillus sp. NJ11]